MDNFDEKIQAFAAMVQEQQLERLCRTMSVNDPNFWLNTAKTTIKPGKKYTKVNVGTSGKYMVVNETGEIFGIKAYGVIHRGYRYGTLDTINDWYWGDYSAYPKYPKTQNVKK